MSSIVRVEQGSAQWHEHRRKYRNASETPIVLGVSPWTTPYQLWQLKLGLIEPEVTPAMQRGTDLEPLARAAYERQTGRTMQPLVVVDGEYSASLDGVTLGGERVVEIKCPVKGRESKLWGAVAAGCLPLHYQWQVEHQLMVTKASVADVFVFDGAEGVVLEVLPAPETWARIHEAWDKFVGFVASRTPPQLSQGDVRMRTDDEWGSAAAHYIETKLLADQAQSALAEAKNKLIDLASHTSEKGHGVTVTKYWQQGGIDYKKIPELKALDLEPYRGAAREQVRLTTT